MRLDTGDSRRCLWYAGMFMANAFWLAQCGMSWAAVLAFGFAADAVRRAPVRP